MFIARVTTDPQAPTAIRRRLAYLDAGQGSGKELSGFGAILSRTLDHAPAETPMVRLPEWATYLERDDVVAVTSNSQLNVVYRRSASANSLLVTEQCSSNCIMCSQPPKAASDTWLYDLAIASIEHVPQDAREIGVTGGEPLLNMEKFVTLLYRLKTMLPSTAVHVLSNGRLLSYLRYAQAIGDIRHPNEMVGIPLYSANPARHDFVVQAQGAFDQTIRGILNAQRCGVPVELRVVLHRQTAGTLDELAAFIARNLPFVDQVALMGLEHIGYVKANANILKEHPRMYAEQIRSFVSQLSAARVRTHVFNLPLCFLPREAWAFARQSISDWKNDVPPPCEGCAVRHECSGFFTWNVAEYEDSVSPFSSDAASEFRRVVGRVQELL